MPEGNARAAPAGKRTRTRSGTYLQLLALGLEPALEAVLGGGRRHLGRERGRQRRSAANGKRESDNFPQACLKRAQARTFHLTQPLADQKPRSELSCASVLCHEQGKIHMSMDVSQMHVSVGDVTDPRVVGRY